MQATGREEQVLSRKSAARYSRGRGGGVDVCCQSWRGVVFGDIVSHPSRQHSSGAGTRGRERRYAGSNGRGGDSVYARRVMRRCMWCRLGCLDPGPGTVPGTRASSGGVLVW